MSEFCLFAVFLVWYTRVILCVIDIGN